MGLHRWMGVGLLAIVMAAAPLSADARNDNRKKGAKAALIDQLSGTVTVLDRVSGEAVALATGDRIRPGERLTVGAGSMVVATLHDGSLLEAGGDCSVTVHKGMKGAWLELHEGQMTVTADGKRQPRIDLDGDRAAVAGTSIVAFTRQPDGERLVEVITGAVGIVAASPSGVMPEVTLTLTTARLDTRNNSAVMRMSGEIQHSTFPLSIDGHEYVFTHLTPGGGARGGGPGQGWDGGTVLSANSYLDDGLPPDLWGTPVRGVGWERLSGLGERCDGGFDAYQCRLTWYRCMGHHSGLKGLCTGRRYLENYIHGPPYDYSSKDSDSGDEDSTTDDDDDGAKDHMHAGVVSGPLKDDGEAPTTRTYQQLLDEVYRTGYPVRDDPVEPLAGDTPSRAAPREQSAVSRDSSYRPTRATRSGSSSSSSTRSSGSSGSSRSSGSSGSSRSSSSSSSSSSKSSSGKSSGSKSSGGSSSGKSKSKK